jgi:hypothetical protein
MLKGKIRVLLIIAAILLAMIAVNYYAGTRIAINGKQITNVWQYTVIYLGLMFLAAVLVLAIPSALILGAMLAIIFCISCLVFFPLLPIAFLLLPGIIMAGIVWLIYRFARKKT